MGLLPPVLLSALIPSVLKLVFIHFKKLFQTANCFAYKTSLSLPFLVCFNFFACSICFILCIFVKTMDTFFFNITSDVLSYAYQLLFYITLSCKHSSILPVLLSLGAVPFSSIQHKVGPDDRQIDV